MKAVADEDDQWWQQHPRARRDCGTKSLSEGIRIGRCRDTIFQRRQLRRSTRSSRLCHGDHESPVIAPRYRGCVADHMNSASRGARLGGGAGTGLMMHQMIFMKRELPPRKVTPRLLITCRQLLRRQCPAARIAGSDRLSIVRSNPADVHS